MNSEIKHLPFGDEVVSYLYQPSRSSNVKGRIIMTPGLGDGVDEHDEAVMKFAELGYSTVKISEPHSNGRLRVPRWRGATVNQHAVDGLWIVNDHIFEEPTTPLYLFGPSLGARTVVEAAQQRPEAITGGVIVLNPAMCPEGVTYTQKTLAYFKNSLQSFREGNHTFQRGSFKTVGRLMSSPIKSLQRGGKALEQTMPQAVFELAEQEIKTVVILGENDPLFVSEETKSCLADYFANTYSQKVAGGTIFSRSLEQFLPSFIDEPGGHYLGGSGERYAELGIAAINTITQGREHILFER